MKIRGFIDFGDILVFQKGRFGLSKGGFLPGAASGRALRILDFDITGLRISGSLYIGNQSEFELFHFEFWNFELADFELTEEYCMAASDRPEIQAYTRMHGTIYLLTDALFSASITQCDHAEHAMLAP